MTEEVTQAATGVPVMITILTATNTILVASVAFFLKRFLNKFDSVVKNVELHNVVLSTSQARCDERSARVNIALSELQNDQERQDELIDDHSRTIAVHTSEIENLKRSIPRK